MISQTANDVYPFGCTFFCKIAFYILLTVSKKKKKQIVDIKYDIMQKIKTSIEKR